MSDEIVIAAVGDLLMKPLVLRSLLTRSGSGGAPGRNAYDFDQLFEPVARYLREADLTIGNLETTFAGRQDEYVTTTRRNARTGFPLFTCPDSFAGALQSAGFHVLSTANNHCMDYGISGLCRTLDVLDRNGIAHTGTYRSGQEARSLLVRKVGGIRIGILAYTRDTNKIPVPKGQPAGVNMLKLAKMKDDLRRLRAAADLIIVCMHCGFEYRRKPAVHQKKLVDFFFREGADVVLGSHPHVLQPAEWRRVKDVDGRTRDRFAIYSLGNFVSTRLHGLDTALTGMILRLRVRRMPKGTVRLAGVDYVPTWVHWPDRNEKGHCQIIPLLPAAAESSRYSSEHAERMKRAYRSTLHMYEGVMRPTPSRPAIRVSPPPSRD